MKKIKACVIIFNSSGEILLQKRDEEPESGKWVLFGGGGESGESEIEAARREINEELGCDIENMLFFKRYENNGIEQPIFVADDPIELDKLELHEGSQMRFFPPKVIPTLNDIGFNFKEILLEYLKIPVAGG